MRWPSSPIRTSWENSRIFRDAALSGSVPCGGWIEEIEAGKSGEAPVEGGESASVGDRECSEIGIGHEVSANALVPADVSAEEFPRGRGRCQRSRTWSCPQAVDEPERFVARCWVGKDPRIGDDTK